MSDEQTRLYDDWPEIQQQREAQARDVFGQYLVIAHDSWLKTAHEMLFSGYRYKSPSPQQEQFLNWIATLSEENKRDAFEFIRDMVSGVLFSLLNKVDGNSGSIVNGDYYDRIHILLDIYRETYEPEAVPELVESLSVNTPEEIQLHNSWNVWLDKYSHYSRRFKPNLAP